MIYLYPTSELRPYGLLPPKKAMEELIKMARCQSEQILVVNGNTINFKGVRLASDDKDKIRKNLQEVANYYGMETYITHPRQTKSRVFIPTDSLVSTFEGWKMTIEWIQGDDAMEKMKFEFENVSIKAGVPFCNSKFV